MPVEFISLTFPNASNELQPLPPTTPIDPDYLTRYARSLDDDEFNYTLLPYFSGGFDPVRFHCLCRFQHRSRWA